MKKTLIRKSQYKGLPLFPGRSPYVKAHLDDAIDVLYEATRGNQSIVACKIEIEIDHSEWEDALSGNGKCLVDMISIIADGLGSDSVFSDRDCMELDKCPVHAAWRYLYFQDMSSKYQMVLLVDPKSYFALVPDCDPFSAFKELVTMAWAEVNDIALPIASRQIQFTHDCVRTFQCDSNGIRSLFPTIGMLCSDRESLDKVFVSMFGASRSSDE